VLRIALPVCAVAAGPDRSDARGLPLVLAAVESELALGQNQIVPEVIGGLPCKSFS
jgi:hypothetical protein